MQLVAYGAQDIYLTGNPQITFFKVVYRRHTNFAMEAIEQTFNGVADFGNKIVCTIARNGDLVGRMYLEVDVSQDADGAGHNERTGHKLVKSAEIEIGGQRIDKHYGEWLDIWTQLCCSEEELHKLHTMVSGHVAAGGLTTVGSGGTPKMYIPLQFWFNRNPGLALPLIALQYHEVKVVIEFTKRADIVGGVEGGVPAVTYPQDTRLSNVCLFCDYIFLDTDERRRFAQVSHEYLIEQVQTTGTCSFKSGKNKVNITLPFNHPCKELIWVVQNQEQKGTFNYILDNTGYQNAGCLGDHTAQDDGVANGADTDAGKDFVKTAKIQLNGHDRFRQRSGSYFRVVQPYQHHTNGAHQGVSLGNAGNFAGESENNEFGHMYSYSFALRPEEHQPSGTCNFSRIDNAVLSMDLADNSANDTGDLATDVPFNVTDKDVRVYAVNYNVLRIMSGMGGLAYSN
jgi:hypothetical protein